MPRHAHRRLIAHDDQRIDGQWALKHWRWFMGDKGKKDKEKGQKQHVAKDKQEAKRKQDGQPKRNP